MKTIKKIIRLDTVGLILTLNVHLMQIFFMNHFSMVTDSLFKNKGSFKNVNL